VFLMASSFRRSGPICRRAREAARRRERLLRVESLEPRLALAGVAGLLDTTPPVVRSVSLPAAGTYGTGRPLTFRLNFNEPVNVVGNRSDVFLPVEVNYAMRSAQYVSGSGTRSLTFRMNVTANDVDRDGISLGRVNLAAVRDFDFAANGIFDRAGNPASDAIPAVNTSRIRVDASGPVVAASSGLVVRNGQMSLQVTFDGPVFVTGRPMVPVSIGNLPAELRYVGGSGSSTLRFSAPVPQSSVGVPTFRTLVGEVIQLPPGANLKDRLGNAVTPIGGDYGETYVDESGNRIVVIGAHYEALRTGDNKVTKAELESVLTSERDLFNPAQPESYWRDYQNPEYPLPLYDVDVYRVAYRTTIPEQGNRPTVAYGLVAVPHGASGQLPMVSVQHGTLWLKESAPSQAFSWDKTSEAVVKYGLRQKDFYGTCFETRLNVAQFAGQGYAVIAADDVGIGNSIENDSFVVKQSEQQSCLDMLAASERLLASRNLVRSDLFLNGWSQGALVSISFQEALEARGVAISGVSTVATPANTGMFAEGFIFNRRPYSEVTVPDWPWAIFVHQFSSFALASYSGQTNSPLELFGGNYDFSRTFYMREYEFFPSFEWRQDVRGDMVPVMVMDGDVRDVEVSRFLDQRAVRSPRAYESTAYAKLIESVGSGKTRLVSDMKMYYGAQDEGYTTAVCTFVDTWQRGTFGKTNIEQVEVPHASHRGAFLTAVAGQIEWFNARRGHSTGHTVPGAVGDLVATLSGSGTEATLTWTSPATNGSPITDYRVEQRLVGGSNWTTMFTGSVIPAIAWNSLVAGQRYEFRVFAISQGRTGLSSNVAVTGNHAPTGSVAMAAPNPATGEVTGLLSGTDSDGDPLTYQVVTWPAKGSVTLNSTTTVGSSQGSFTYTPTAAARHAAAAPGATPADLSDTFSVTISDGYGGTVSVPISVPIG